MHATLTSPARHGNAFAARTRIAGLMPGPEGRQNCAINSRVTAVPDNRDHRPYRILLALVAAGEAAFFLPFLLARVFRPAVLDVLNISNFELGTAYGVYGAVAMAAYLFGGPLADRYHPRRMLAVALVGTAGGGLVLLMLPSLSALILLYAFWGVTTIALFWAPLIKATRDWGGEHSQGMAFGILDGGRGLLAALLGSLMVTLFAANLPADAANATLTDRSNALRLMIAVLITATLLCALLVWRLLPAATPATANTRPTLVNALRPALRLPTVWLQAIIVLCAYTGFRAIDDFSLYANEVLQLDEVTAAGLSTVSLWVRPIAAIGAGLVADRFSGSRTTIVAFAVLAVGNALLAGGTGSLHAFFLLGVVSASLGVFALRGLYFAIMRDSRIPAQITGSAVGIVSVVGYTPDVFMGPLTGWLLDSNPGAAGHQLVFQVVTAFAVTGLAASVLFHRITRFKNT